MLESLEVYIEDADPAFECDDTGTTENGKMLFIENPAHDEDEDAPPVIQLSLTAAKLLAYEIEQVVRAEQEKGDREVEASER